MFYVYEWFIKDTDEIIYVGKGVNNRFRVKKRNRLFNEMIKRFDCDVRIIKYFDDEQEAFNYEFKHTAKLKEKGLAVCNLHYGGNGGVQKVWTKEMRQKMSDFNPMKSKKQRERMSKNNPMKNPEIAKRTNKCKQKGVIIDGLKFNSVKEAALYYNVWDITISRWCKRGYNTDGKPCRYISEKQKEYTIKTTNSKPVFIEDKLFPNVKTAAKYIGVWSETLIKAIKKNKTCKGYKCHYA